MAWKIWKIASLKRGMMNMGSGNFKTKIVNRLFKNWDKYHAPIEFSPKTFNQMWKEERSLK